MKGIYMADTNDDPVEDILNPKKENTGTGIGVIDDLNKV